MLRWSLIAIFAVLSATAHATTLGPLCRPVDRSEFVSQLLTVGLEQTAPTKFITKAGVVVTISSAAEFCFYAPLSDHTRFSGSARAPNGYFSLQADEFDTDSEATAAFLDLVSRYRVELRFLNTHTLELSGGVVLVITQSGRQSQ